MISKTSILHERDATFQSQWPFGVDETLLSEMRRPFKNELFNKNVVSRRRNAYFFAHPVLSGGACSEAWHRLSSPQPPITS